MRNEVQDNWNKVYNIKKRPSKRQGRIVVLIIAILALAVPAFFNRDYLAQVLKNGFGSSFDGVQMNNMVSKVNDSIEENIDYVNEFVSAYNINSFTKADELIDEWYSFVTTSMNVIGRIDYHKSYDEFMSSALYALHTTEQFITDLKANKLDPKSIGISIDKINKQSGHVMDELVKAFDKNRIVYTRIDDGEIVYQYKIK